MSDLPFPWNIYEDNQKKLNRSYRITDRTWSIESGLAKPSYCCRIRRHFDRSGGQE
jgi:hypothetical protein